MAVGGGPWRLPWAFAETASVSAWQLVSTASCPRREEQEAASPLVACSLKLCIVIPTFFMFVRSE